MANSSKRALNSIGISVLIFSAIFTLTIIIAGIGGEFYAVYGGLTWHSLMLRIQWESILAGALGLAGGIFVLAASRAQITAVEKSTNETLHQSKVHHADARTSILRLALEMSEDTHEWARKAIELLEHQRKQSEESTPNTEQSEIWKKALHNVNLELVTRSKYASEVLSAHGVTSFNYLIHNAIFRLSRAVLVDSHVMLPANAPKPIESHMVTMKRLKELSAASAQAKTYIDQAITRICRECDLK